MEVDPTNALARIQSAADESVCIKMIMSSKAAARPQKLQKRRQKVHRFDKSRRE
jgi:hypothetical protein